MEDRRDFCQKERVCCILLDWKVVVFMILLREKITFWKAQAKFYLSRDSIEARGGPRRANDAVIVLLTLVHFLSLPSRPLSLSFASF